MSKVLHSKLIMTDYFSTTLVYLYKGDNLWHVDSDDYELYQTDSYNDALEFFESLH